MAVSGSCPPSQPSSPNPARVRDRDDREQALLDDRLHRKDPDVIDEAPKAYKNIDKVMTQQTDLVEIVAELKQVLCVKG